MEIGRKLACLGAFGLGVLGLLGRADNNAVESNSMYETNAETQVIGRYNACKKIVDDKTKKTVGWQESLDFKTNETFYFTAKFDGKINGRLEFWLYDENGERVKRYSNRQWHIYTREGALAALPIMPNSLHAGSYTHMWYLNDTVLSSKKVNLSE